MVVQRLWQKVFPWSLVIWCVLGIILHFNLWLILTGIGIWILLLFFTIPGLFWTYAYMVPFTRQNIKLLQKAVEAKPQLPNPYFMYGVYWAKQRKYDQAIPLLETVLHYSGKKSLPKHQLNLAVVYRENGQYQKTVDILTKLISQGIKSYPIYITLAVTFLRQNNLPEALESARKARSFNVNATEPVLVMGKAHFQMGDFATAKDDYQWAIAHTSWPVESYYWLGRAEFELGELETAETHLKTSVERITEDPLLSDVPATEAESWLLKVQNIQSNR